MTANADEKQGRFKPGRSGNPSGKKPGTLNNATRAVLALLDGEAEALTRKAVNMALDGDTTALRLCLERLAPPAKSRPVRFDLPPVRTAADCSEALGAVLAAVAAGNLTPDEASAVAGLLEARRKAIETVEFDARITALEGKKS